MTAISKDRLRYRQLADISSYRKLTEAEQKEFEAVKKRERAREKPQK